VGACEGALVGEGEGDVVGEGVGAFDGEVEGVFDGDREGAYVGLVVVGDCEGAFVGFVVVGESEGALVGCDITSNSQHTTDATSCIPSAAPEWPSITCVTTVPSGQTSSCAPLFSASANSNTLIGVDSPIFALAPRSITFHFAAFSNKYFCVFIIVKCACVISSTEYHQVIVSTTRCTFRPKLLIPNFNEAASLGNNRRMTTKVTALNLGDIIFIFMDSKPRDNFVVSTRPSY
jgi:hypothetical protein